MAQASAAASLDQPSSTNAIANMRRAAFASGVRDAALRNSPADRSDRLIATVLVASHSDGGHESHRPASLRLTFESTVQRAGISNHFRSQDHVAQRINDT